MSADKLDRIAINIIAASEHGVTASWVADRAMEAIGFPRDLNELGYDGCHREFIRIAIDGLHAKCHQPTVAHAARLELEYQRMREQKEHASPATPR